MQLEVGSLRVCEDVTGLSASERREIERSAGATHIYAAGYADPPHPGCFQTFESNDVATFDVVISKNSCQRVDAQCQIASAERTGNSGAPAGVRSLTFLANICSVGGAGHQPAALAQRRGARQPDHGQAHVPGHSGRRGVDRMPIVDNTHGAGIRPAEVDNSSLPGCVVSGNGSPARPSRLGPWAHGALRRHVCIGTAGSDILFSQG